MKLVYASVGRLGLRLLLDCKVKTYVTMCVCARECLHVLQLNTATTMKTSPTFICFKFIFYFNVLSTLDRVPLRII